MPPTLYISTRVGDGVCNTVSVVVVVVVVVVAWRPVRRQTSKYRVRTAVNNQAEMKCEEAKVCYDLKA